MWSSADEFDLMLEAKETVIHANDSQKLGPRGAQRSFGSRKKCPARACFKEAVRP